MTTYVEEPAVADVTDQVTDEEEDRRQFLLREVSRRLKEARLAHWPIPRQEDWAKQMGLKSVRQYQRWEHGHELPSIERLPKIIEVSGADFTDLFEPPGGMTRDGLKSYFDSRIQSVEELVEQNQQLIQLALHRLEVLNGTILEEVRNLGGRRSESENL